MQVPTWKPGIPWGAATVHPTDFYIGSMNGGSSKSSGSICWDARCGVSNCALLKAVFARCLKQYKVLDTWTHDPYLPCLVVLRNSHACNHDCCRVCYLHFLKQNVAILCKLDICAGHNASGATQRWKSGAKEQSMGAARGRSLVICRGRHARRTVHAWKM